jgi:opacity protein-like surface antigen
MLRKLNKKYRVLFIFIPVSVLLSTPLSAITRSSNTEFTPIVTVTMGASLSQAGSNQSFQPLDLCRYTYKPDAATTNMLWGGFVGTPVARFSSSKLIAGFGYYQPNTLFAKGSLTQGVDRASNETYQYQYRIRSQQALLEGKWYWHPDASVQPFLMAGMGVAFNRVSHYETNVPPFYEFTPLFSSHTQTHFTYAVGPGMEMSLSKTLRGGLAYRFTDLGVTNTGSAQIDTIPISSTLKQSHLYANQVLIQLTYILG